MGLVMDSGLAVKMMAELCWTGLLICLPVLAITMLVGLIISILQAVTQVQEMSLTFVPKLICASLTLVICGPWMLRQLTFYTSKLWLSIPSMM